MSEILDVVNDQDEVIGQAERDEVHRRGLLCRLIYVCFYTTDGAVILQKRSATKKNDPGKLTTAVSGHVGTGQTYLQAAVRETLEETGVEINAKDLISLGTVRADYAQDDYLSYAMRRLFAYRFNGNVANLKVEEGDGAGFVKLPIEDLESQLYSKPDKFATIFTTQVGKDLLQQVKDLQH